MLQPRSLPILYVADLDRVQCTWSSVPGPVYLTPVQTTWAHSVPPKSSYSPQSFKRRQYKAPRTIPNCPKGAWEDTIPYPPRWIMWISFQSFVKKDSPTPHYFFPVPITERSKMSKRRFILVLCKPRTKKSGWFIIRVITGHSRWRVPVYLSCPVHLLIAFLFTPRSIPVRTINFMSPLQ